MTSRLTGNVQSDGPCMQSPNPLFSAMPFLRQRQNPKANRNRLSNGIPDRIPFCGFARLKIAAPGGLQSGEQIHFRCLWLRYRNFLTSPGQIRHHFGSSWSELWSQFVDKLYALVALNLNSLDAKAPCSKIVEILNQEKAIFSPEHCCPVF